MRIFLNLLSCLFFSLVCPFLHSPTSPGTRWIWVPRPPVPCSTLTITTPTTATTTRITIRGVAATTTRPVRAVIRTTTTIIMLSNCNTIGPAGDPAKPETAGSWGEAQGQPEVEEATEPECREVRWKTEILCVAFTTAVYCYDDVMRPVSSTESLVKATIMDELYPDIDDWHSI